MLLVEDDDDHAELVSFVLTSLDEGLDVVRCVDGVDALKYLAREERYENVLRPDLVLVDLKLPRVDGIGVIRGAKQDQATCGIPIVMMTTSGAAHDRHRAYAEGVNSYVVKQMGFEQMRAMLNDVLSYWGRWNKAGTEPETGGVAS